jgi:hypothetical protein
VTEDSRESQKCLHLEDRLGLGIDEAARTIGLSPGAFRDHVLPRCPKFYAGKRVVIPRRLFLKFIEGLALEEAQQGKETAAELLAATEGHLE